jgi:hypothetical protein
MAILHEISQPEIFFKIPFDSRPQMLGILFLRRFPRPSTSSGQAKRLPQSPGF